MGFCENKFSCEPSRRRARLFPEAADGGHASEVFAKTNAALAKGPWLALVFLASCRPIPSPNLISGMP